MVNNHLAWIAAWPDLRRNAYLACIAISLATSACISGPGYPAPDGASRPIGTGFTPSQQQGRWVCDGFDLVLSGGTLYELNREYAMSKGTPNSNGTEFRYGLAGYSFTFAVPSDRAEPLIIGASGGAVTSTFNTTSSTGTQTSSYSSASGESSSSVTACSAQPAVTVW